MGTCYPDILFAGQYLGTCHSDILFAGQYLGTCYPDILFARQNMFLRGFIVIEIFVTVIWDGSVCTNPTNRGCLAHGTWLELGIPTGHLGIC